MNQGTFGSSLDLPCPEPGAAKAWVIFAGGATQAAVKILASYNVAKVTRNGGGLYTITFIRPFSSGSFAYMANGKASAGAALIAYAAITDPGSSGAKQVQWVNPNVAVYDPPECCFMAWGPQ